MRLRRRRAWVSLRRIQREGVWNSFRRWRLWSSILDSPAVITRTATKREPVEVHLLCHQGDYLCALWALKSFYRFASVDYPLAIHLQGNTSPAAAAKLRRHFPHARVISQADADPHVVAWLQDHAFTRLLAARSLSPFMMKLTDFPVFSTAVHMLTLDSDVLFFRRPEELVAASAAPSEKGVFQRDLASTYNITEEQALKHLGIRLAPRVNTGITLLARENIRLDRCEEYLKCPQVARPTGWIEQTLHALCASELDRVAYLPESYLVSLEPGVNSAELTARHYAGPSRPLLTSEGMPYLVSTGFLRRQ